MFLSLVDNKKRYSKYQFNRDPEIIFEDKGY